MNFLIFLDPQANELEKILSGTKTMLVKGIDPAQPSVPRVNPGDSLYFLRDHDDRTLRVSATVVRVVAISNRSDQDPSQTLKEMQPRLQLTEAQYNHWSTRKQFTLVEFEAAHKIPVVQIAPHKPIELSGWIAFEKLSLIAVVE